MGLIAEEMFTPNFEAALSLVSHLNSKELSQLLSDDGKIEKIIADLQQIKTIAAEKEMLIASSRSFAEYNLSLQPVLENYSKELIKLYQQADLLHSRVSAKKSALAQAHCQGESKIVLAVLQTAATKAEEESEVQVQKLLEEEIALEKFLHDYIQKRTSAHILRTKFEKMKAMLHQNAFEFSTDKEVNKAFSSLSPPVLCSLKYPTVMKSSLSTASHTPLPVIAPIRQAPKPPVQIHS